MTNTHRNWLIAALTNQNLPALTEQQYHELLDEANANGVLVILEKSLKYHPQVAEIDTDLLAQLQSAAKQVLMDQLVFLGEQKKVLTVLNVAGIPYILMKGAALGHWLYESPMDRPITDIDIWLRDKESVFSLRDLLEPLGYVCQPSLGALTTQEQAFDKIMHDSIIRIDAHWQMFNSALLSKYIDFEDMYARAICIDAEQPNGKYLAINEALINSIGHRAMKYITKNGYVLKWLLDQHLMFSQLSNVQWQQLIKQSQQYAISDLTLDALQVSATQFATRVPESVLRALQQQANNEKIKRRWFQSWLSYQWHEMCAAAPTFSAKLFWFQQRFWPNPEAVRERHGKNDPVWKFMFKRIGFGIKRLFR